MSDLLDTYISEIGRNLPRGKRQDIEIEIRSSLQDLLDDRSQQSGRLVDDEMMFEVLKEYGSPEKVASGYLPERYLIGPRLFPIFLLVLRIALPVVAVLTLIGLGISFSTRTFTPDQIFDTLLKSLVGLAGSLMQVFGNIVLVFAILQWFLPSLEMKAQTWDPRSLLKIKPSDHVSLGQSIVDLSFALAAIVVFNFYPHILRIWNMVDGTMTSYEVFSNAFFRYIPAWTAIWFATVVLNVILLSRGRWHNWIRWTAVAISAATIMLAIIMLTGPSLIHIDTASLAALYPHTNVSFDDWLENSLQITVRLVLVIIIIAESVDLVKMLMRIFEKDLPAFFTARK